MKFFRLLKGELNKILMRPILYVITGILVVALFFSFFIYNPTNRSDSSITMYDECENLSDIYTLFNSSTNQYGKQSTNNLVDSGTRIIETVKTNNNFNAAEDLSSRINKTINSFSNYKEFDSVFSESGKASDEEQRLYQQIKEDISSLKQKFEEYRDANFSSIIINSADNFTLNQLFLSTLNEFNIDQTSHEAHLMLRKNIIEKNYLQKINEKINTIQQIKVSDENLEELSLYITTANNMLSKIDSSIDEIYNSGNLEQLDELKNQTIRYYLVGTNINRLVRDVVTYSPLLSLPDHEINQYFGYDGIHSYQIKERIVMSKFLLDNNAVSSDYANVFTATKTSNSEKNAFDFVYFGLEITTFIIIVFTVVIAAGMLAGEQSSGTLKLLLIRPYSRSKILTSKLLATMIFATIFLLFSTIVLFLIGLFTMGANFTAILCVFNASSAFVVSPFVLLLIYLACILFKILMYILLALAISAIFRSNVAAVGVSIVLYFMLSIFGTIFAGTYWYGYLPFSNLDLFKYLGGSFIANGSLSPLQVIFSTPMFYEGSFTYSLLISLGFGLILLSLTYLIFRKREVK